MNCKITGAFYTPSKIADFFCDYIGKIIAKDNIEILEPSVGDGQFIKSISKLNTFKTKIKNITAIDINDSELTNLNQFKIFEDIPINIIHDDFLNYQSIANIKFDLIIGNPPYIKRTLLNKFQLDKISKINADFNINNISAKNIWPSFILSSIKLLNDDGMILFVLPAELMQVKYASDLRKILLKEFNRIEIFTFNNLIFESCKGQDTIVFFGEKKTKKEKGLFFYNILDSKKPYIKKELFLKHVTDLNLKWTSYLLNKDEIKLINKLIDRLPILSELCTSKPGVVTAANQFFIINKIKKDEFLLPENNTLPIIQKSSILKNGIVIDESFFDKISLEGIPCYLLNLNGVNVKFYKKLCEYISEGESLNLHNRYKMLKRDIWFNVNNIKEPSPILFFKRSHLFPKLIRNDAKLIATDSAYYVYPNDDVIISNLIGSFYNSITMIMAEIYGRYYGGGVLELTPNEFRALPIPYSDYSENDLQELNNSFLNKVKINEILEKNDRRLFSKYFKDISESDFRKIKIIREKLSNRRLRGK